MPTWVKVFIVIGAVLLALVLVAQLAGGNHGPGRHLGAGEAVASASLAPM